MHCPVIIFNRFLLIIFNRFLNFKGLLLSFQKSSIMKSNLPLDLSPVSKNQDHPFKNPS